MLSVCRAGIDWPGRAFVRQRDVIAAHRTNDLLQWQRHLEVSADVCLQVSQV